jgi:MEDS: MEthanogen/methylotroph, DcmR Sensory domain
MDMTTNWPELLRHPAGGDHIVQVYQDEAFLADAVAEYVGQGLRQGEAVVVIASAAHIEAFTRKLGLDAVAAAERGQLRLLDAQATLAQFTPGGRLDWTRFHAVVGGLIAELRLQYPAVRAYGEMVDVLWQRGEREVAIRLEEFWNDLARLQTFSLFCAYYMDNLDAAAYGGPLECVCKVHTHLIPARDYSSFNESVSKASKAVLDQPLAQMLMSLAASHRPATQMPLGQATLLWLKQNMPRTAERVLARLREA